MSAVRVAVGSALLAAALAMPCAASAADLAGEVNPLAGSLGSGFPMVGASLPFGMIEPGPDTSLPDGSQNPVTYCGYGYEDPNIRGFSLTHFDGAGIHIGGDLPFMATTGTPTAPAADHAGDSSPYDHATEVSQPGYYAATLGRYQTRAELTGTARAAMMRFTFPSTGQGNVLAEVSRSVNGNNAGSVTVVGANELEGYVHSDVGYRVYFTAVFDRPFSAYGTYSGSTLSSGARQASGSDAGASVSFDTSSNPTVTMRVGISFIDQAGAERNLGAELPAARSFDRVRGAAHAAWDRRLRDVVTSGGATSERQTFYTNLYRAMLMPQLFDDADGRYLGMDGQLHSVTRGHHHYTALSLWDTYRSQSPLLALIEPHVMSDVMTSLLDDADQNHGVIPRWVQANIDRGIMAGDSGSASLADGVMNGLLSATDAHRALADLIHQATTLPPVWPREHLDADTRYGYIPQEVDGISASVTLEYATDDYAVAQVARTLGDSADADALEARAQNWRHLMDPSTHFLRPRNSDGSWATPSHDAQVTSIPAPAWSPDFQDGYQEATGWQDLWAVPHDVSGLAAGMGGSQTALGRLDSFFSTALNQPAAPAVPVAQQYSSLFGVYYLGNQYTPANEPDLWAPWYYDWLGQPWKTQKVVRSEMASYNARPDGLPGNDDTGAMSGWYVLAALGLYHAAPGVAAWELNSPAFPAMSVRLGDHRLEIRAPSAGVAEPYVHAAGLDGVALSRTYLSTCELRSARSLDFTLGVGPDMTWGTDPGSAPPSASSPARAPVSACTSALGSALGGA